MCVCVCVCMCVHTHAHACISTYMYACHLLYYTHMLAGKEKDYLITISMTSYNNWLGPGRDQSWYVLTDYSLSEHCSTKDVADCAIWWLPHLLQLKFCKELIRWDTFRTFIINSHARICLQACNYKNKDLKLLWLESKHENKN